MKTKVIAGTEKEARIIKNMMTSTTLKSDVIDEFLQIYTRFFFISNSFLSNCTQFYEMIKQLQYW